MLIESSVGRLLRQLGFSCQKPLYRAYQQNPNLVAERKKKVVPEIKKKPKNLTQLYILKMNLDSGLAFTPAKPGR